MLGELLTILADQPEKIEKALIRGIRIILNIFISATLYKYVVGNYTIISLENYSELVKFVLSGNILICLFIYFLSDYIIIPLIDSIASLPLLGVKLLKFLKFTDNDALTFLKFFNVIKVKDKNAIPLPGKNIELLKTIAESLDDDEIREEVIALKNTIIKNVWNLYVIFFILYYLVLDKSYQTHFLSTIIVSGLVTIFLFMVSLQVLFEYLFENYKTIYKSLAFIKTYAIINDAFTGFDIEITKGSKRSGLSKFNTFFLNNKQYIIIQKFHGERVYSDKLQTLLSEKKKPNRFFIVIVHKDFIDDTSTLRLENFENLILLEYTDDENLKKQLYNTVPNL